MGTRSAQNWSNTVVAGVLLGEPAVNEDDGSFEWDGGVPNGVIDADGMFHPDDQESPPTNVGEMPGVVSPEWVQPAGAHDAYPTDVVVAHNDLTWVSLHDANAHEPGVSGWRAFSETGEIQPWVQPAGAHDAYKLGALVTHKGSTWENTGSDANVWEPGVYGWVVVNTRAAPKKKRRKN